MFVYDQRHEMPTEKDLEHAVGLYDGNLRTVDNAVETVFDALRARGRWDNTIVLITADHGEAFFEHFRMGHNNTVYDEMLRVPFILRLPEGSDLEGYDLDRLATLEDIVPTLLAAASLEPVAQLDGVNLLDRDRPATLKDDRFVVGQTAHPVPARFIRSPRFKVILANSGQGELYDLFEDPAEKRNLRSANPELFVGLGQLLTGRLLEPPSITGGAGVEEVSEADREMLEALGYVE
jgi:arylsulfatase A-like enzyme